MGRVRRTKSPFANEIDESCQVGHRLRSRPCQPWALSTILINFRNCGLRVEAQWDDPQVAASDDSGPETIVLASFPTRRAGEHMLATLRRKFRRTARKGHATALVVSANRDGSLLLKQSRVLTASGFVSTLIRLSLSWTVGFMGIISSLKGAEGGIHAVRVRERHVGSDEHRAHAILAEAGPRAAVVLVRCRDQEMSPHVTKQASEHACYGWHGSRREFLAGVDPGSQYDWVRAALGEESSASD